MSLKELLDMRCSETRMEIEEWNSSLNFMELSNEENEKFTNISLCSSGDARKNKASRFSHQGKWLLKEGLGMDGSKGGEKIVLLV